MRRGLLFLVLAGCGGSTGTPPDAAGPPDAEPPPETVKESREIVSGGGRLTSGSMTVDVQVGHGMGQQQMSGGSFVVEGAASVKRKPEAGTPSKGSKEPNQTERKVAP